MSSPPILRNDPQTDFETASAPYRVASIVARKLFAPLEFVGFWVAVALPFGYLPLLYYGYLSATRTAFVALIALNVVAMMVGHGYKRD